jgi:hypothetical protein
MTKPRSIPIADLGTLKNELARYKKGKKLDIRLFNQVARLAWLGRIVLCPLDPEDPQCRSWLLHLQPPEGLAAQIIRVDEDLNGMPFASQIHILDAAQGAALAAIFREGMAQRARELQALEQRDFYFEKFFDGKKNQDQGNGQD